MDRKKLFQIALALSLIYPVILIIKTIIEGSMPFWYDPARDLLLALDNLRKPTLIGPPSGIPGIFYGPYWVWLLSLGITISKDPRLIVFLTCAIFYLTVFPYILWKFSKLFPKRITVLLWLLFIINYYYYATQIWSPNIAPFLYLITLFLLLSAVTENKPIAKHLKFFAVGIFSALIINFHISFGLGISLSIFLFFVIDLIYKVVKEKTKWKHIVISELLLASSFTIGFLVIFLPFMAFEIRHGFHQIKAIVTTLDAGIFHNSSVVGQVGLSKKQIWQYFLGRQADILKIPEIVNYGLYALFIILIIYRLITKKINLKNIHLKFLLILILNCVGILYLYLNTKNPVWNYHFIGTEIIFIFLLGLLLIEFPILEKAMTLWVVVLIILNIIAFIKSFYRNQLSVPSYITEKHIVETVYKDAGKKKFAYFAYHPAIYTYDYDYLFAWLGRDKYTNIAEKDIKKADFVYLIIPKTKKEVFVDFVGYRTSYKDYQTIKEWHIPDGTTILKRALR